MKRALLSGIAFVGVSTLASGNAMANPAIIAAIKSAEVTITAAVTKAETSIVATITKGVGQLSNNMKSQTEAMIRVQEEMNKDRVTVERQRGLGEARGAYRYNQAECTPVVGGLQQQNVAYVSGDLASNISMKNVRVFSAGAGTAANTRGDEGGKVAAFDAAKNYCTPIMAARGFCTVSTDGFQSVSNIPFSGANFNAMTVMHPNLLAYKDSKEEAAANDFQRLLLDPVTPKETLDLNDSYGQRAYVYRMSRDAGLSVASSVISRQIASRTKTFDTSVSPYTQFTEMQQRYLASINREATGKFSEKEITDMEINRRFGNVDWAKEVQKMDTNNIGKETLQLLAFQNYMLGKVLEKLDENNMIGAAMLGHSANEAKQRQYGAQ